MVKLIVSAVVLLFAFTVPHKYADNKPGTKLILLGTGTPNPDPDKFGPGLAIVVNNASYIVDCGAGIVRRATAAARKYDLPALNAANLKTLFITHLHSDHTIGYPDIILTPAVVDRNAALNVYGPKGTAFMTEHLLKAYGEDIKVRTEGLEHGNPAAYKVNVHEIAEGIVYKDSNVVVKAFKVSHGSWKEAYGFRFETKDKVIVVSGDCTYSENLVRNAQGCDILVHEVYSLKGFAARDSTWQAYHSAFHTSAKQLADIANKVHPKLLVLTHELLWSATKEDLMNEISSRYSGPVAFGNDLDMYE
jgi:ribonuclease Z